MSRSMWKRSGEWKKDWKQRHQLGGLNKFASAIQRSKVKGGRRINNDYNLIPKWCQ